METMRFLMVSTHFPPFHLGGDAVFVEYLARELVNRGHEVHIAFNPSIQRMLRSEGRGLKNAPPPKEIAVHDLSPTTPMMSAASSLMLGASTLPLRRLANTIREVRPQVVHWHNTKGFISRPICIEGVNSVCTAHDYYLICHRSNLRRPDMSTCTLDKSCITCNLRWQKLPPLWRYGRNRVLRLHDSISILSPSEYVAGALRRDGLEVKRVIPNFVPHPTQPCDTHEIQKEDSFILYLGMLESHKGPATLLRAFARSKKEHEFRLIFVGEGSLRLGLERLSRDLNVSDRVKILGFLSRDRLNDLRRLAAVHVVPSEWPENAPLTAIESLSYGTPFLAAHTGGLPEIVNSESGGITFEPGNVTELANEIAKSWNGYDKLKSRRQMALNSYLSRYTPERHLRDYLEFISNSS